jgi:hypothetical protein
MICAGANGVWQAHLGCQQSSSWTHPGATTFGSGQCAFGALANHPTLFLGHHCHDASPESASAWRTTASASSRLPLKEVAQWPLHGRAPLHLPPPSANGQAAPVRPPAASIATATSFPRDLVKLCTAHDKRTKTDRAYQRSGLLEKRREIMKALARLCDPRSRLAFSCADLAGRAGLGSVSPPIRAAGRGP